MLFVTQIGYVLVEKLLEEILYKIDIRKKKLAQKQLPVVAASAGQVSLILFHHG